MQATRFPLDLARTGPLESGLLHKGAQLHGIDHVMVRRLSGWMAFNSKVIEKAI